MLPMLAAFLMASCGDPTVSYWQKVADINTEYSKKSDALVQRLLKLKKNPTLRAWKKAAGMRRTCCGKGTKNWRT